MENGCVMNEAGMLRTLVMEILCLTDHRGLMDIRHVVGLIAIAPIDATTDLNDRIRCPLRPSF